MRNKSAIQSTLFRAVGLAKNPEATMVGGLRISTTHVGAKQTAVPSFKTESRLYHARKALNCHSLIHGFRMRYGSRARQEQIDTVARPTARSCAANP